MKHWKLTDGKNYLCGVLSEGILMMDSPSENDLIIINDEDLKDLEDDSFIDEITLAEVFFNDLSKIQIK